MADYVIPCETFARLCNLFKLPIKPEEPWFNCVRIDDGVAVVTTGQALVAENIGGASGVIHIMADPALIKQRADEGKFNSVLTITVVPEIKFATAKTSFGYQHQGNCCLWLDQPNPVDGWRSIVDKVRTPAKKPSGAMEWNADVIHAIATASPSGTLVFETVIDTDRPTIVRDMTDYNWFGLFNPWVANGMANWSATVPSWI